MVKESSLLIEHGDFEPFGRPFVSFCSVRQHSMVPIGKNRKASVLCSSMSELLGRHLLLSSLQWSVKNATFIAHS
jgi:hypothetical protein